jgi:glutaredoxin
VSRPAAGRRPSGRLLGEGYIYNRQIEIDPEVMAMTPPAVTIYSLTTCQWSRRAKAYFKERGIPAYVIEYDMAGPELQQKIANEMRANGADGFPFVRIGGRVVRGYDPVSFEQLLRAA